MAVAKQPVSQKMTADDRKKLRRAMIAALLFLLAAAAVSAGMFFAWRALFDANPRLVLHEIRVNGAGYWKEHPEELARKIDLRTGTNLFALDPHEIRQKIIKIPNVENCSVIRVLPDTLVLKVTERVPRAKLNSPLSPWVVDGNAVIMPGMQTMKTSGTLPVIYGVSLSGVKPGTVVKGAENAMALIMTAVRNFPDIRIHRIHMDDPKVMDIRLRYLKFPVCRVIIPVRNRGLQFMLRALQSTIINSRRMGENKNFYDLSYDGKVVVR